MSLGRVTDDPQAIRSRQSEEGIHVRGLAVEVDGNEGLRLRRDLLFDALHVDVVGLRVDVHEHHLRPGHFDGLRGGNKAVRNRDDLVSGTDAERSQGDEERVGAVRDPDTVLNVAVTGKRLLELLDERSPDERRLRDHGRDGGVDFPLDRFVLLLQIHQRDARCRV
jgi:hypothetical protein